MESSYSYAVSYLRGRDEAWVARFLDDLERRLSAVSPVRFVRLPAQDAAGAAAFGGPGTALGAGGAGAVPRALAEADRVLVLCSPAYFAEGPAEADWAVLAHRASLERALGRPGSGSVLPLLWEPIAQRLPDAVAETDTFTAGQPPEYRSLGLALMTMQAARHRAALDQVLDNLTRRLAAVPAGSSVAAADLPDELPPAMAPDDARFTALFRAQAAGPRPYGRTDGRPADRTADRPDRDPAPGAADREVRWREGAADRRAAFGELAAAGRRLLLVGPAGSGRSRQLAALARQITVGSGETPWDCRVAFRVPAATGALPPPDGIVAVAAPALAAREPAGWAARRLRAGQALLAVEGLDHAPHHLRTAAWEWLLRMTDLFPRAACVVETNGTSVPWHRVSAGAFTPVVLQPLAPGRRPRLPELRAADPLAGNGSSGAAASRAAVPNAASFNGSGTNGAGPGPTPAGDPLLRDVAAWPAAAEAVRRAVGAYPAGVMRGRVEVLRAAAAANWRPDAEAANSRARVRDSVLRAAAGGLAAATLAADGTADEFATAAPGPAAVPVQAALDALDGLRAGGAAGVPPERLLSQLADDAGLLYAPEPGTVAFTTEAVRCLLAAEHAAAHPGPAAERLLAAHAERTGSGELAQLVAELAQARAHPKDVPSLLEHGVTGRRLSSEPLPSPLPGTPPPVVVHSLDELLRLAGGPAVPELRCQGLLSAVPAPGSPARSVTRQDARAETGSETRFSAALAAVPGLRSLVIADSPVLRAVPDLGRCTALRSLRLVNCPALRDVSAVAGSGLMFLSVDPWRDSVDLAPLRRARWLRRVELRAADAPPAAPPQVVRVGRAEVHRYTAADPAARLSRT